MIILRNDDVLKPTPTKKFEGREHDRFQFINKMINQSNCLAVHRPTILCTEIMDFPDTIEYCRYEIYRGRMDAQLHGWEHLDYVHKSRIDIGDMLKKSQDWFNDNLDIRFTVWATPWGGDTKLAREVCEKLGVRLESTAGTLGLGQCVAHFKSGGSLDALDGKTVLFHWWNKGNNFGRLAEILKHGSYQAAKDADERGWF